MSVEDKLEAASGPPIVSGTIYRVTSVRAVVAPDGFHALDVSTLKEVSI